MNAPIDQMYLDAVSRELRAAGWYPSRTYLCGCRPEALCPKHSEQRAVDHYHPDLAP